MAQNFPIFVTEDGEEIPYISGKETAESGTRYSIARGELETILFLDKVSQS